MSPVRAGVVIALLVPLLAGCTGDEPAAPEAMDSPPPPPLQGWVFDDAFRPIEGAQVEVQQTGNQSTTDGDGHYTFASAPVDGPIVLVVRTEGYEVASKQIQLQADLPVRLNFTLTALVVKVPRTEILTYSGFITCEGGLAVLGEEIPFQCSGDEAQDAWDIAASEDLAGVVVEIAWTAGTPLADTLHANLETLSLGDLNHVLAEAKGPSVLRLEVPPEEVARIYGSGGLMRLSVTAAVGASDPAGAALHVSQDFQVFASMFYVEPPAPGYTVG